MSKRPWWLLPQGRIHPLWWTGLGAAMLWVDHLIGPEAQYPVIYILPVILAAWYSGRWPALALAVAVPLVRLAFLVDLPTPADERSALALRTAIRGVIIVFMALWFSRLADLERELERRVKVLEGFLSICAFCKKIRNEAGQWEHLEGFISRRSEAQFSHGVCPTCGNIHYPGLMDDETPAHGSTIQ
jgi:hypothetical protein